MVSELMEACNSGCRRKVLSSNHKTLSAKGYPRQMWSAQSAAVLNIVHHFGDGKGHVYLTVANEQAADVNRSEYCRRNEYNCVSVEDSEDIGG